MRAEIAAFVLNLSDIIFLQTAPHMRQWWRSQDWGGVTWNWFPIKKHFRMNSTLSL